MDSFSANSTNIDSQYIGTSNKFKKFPYSPTIFHFIILSEQLKELLLFSNFRSVLPGLDLNMPFINYSSLLA